MPVKDKDKKGRGTAGRAGDFVRETRSELRKVIWPTRRETINLTGIVIGVSAAVGIFLGVVDSGFSQMFQLLLR